MGPMDSGQDVGVIGITKLQAQLARTEEAWRQDGLRLQAQIDRHRLALRYIAGEDIAGWASHLDPREVARDELARPRES